MKYLKSQQGFTFTEMLCCVCLLALFALIAVPTYKGITDRAAETVHRANVRTLEQAAQLYLLDGGEDAIWAPRAGDLPRAEISGPHEGWYPYLEAWPENPTGGDFVVEIEAGEITVWTQGGE